MQDASAGRRGRTLLALILGPAIGLWLASAAGAEGYLLQKGDALALSVVGASELQQTLPVDIEGNILVPLVGPLPAAGRTLDSVTLDVRNALAQASYTVISGGGEILTLQILPEAVTLGMAEYRPVYVDGDVLTPGAFPYAPGLTARRAIAIAGGYGLARLRGTDPMPQLLGLQGERRKLLAERAAAEVRLAAARALLAGEDAAAAGTGAAPPALQVPAEDPSRELTATLAGIETRWLGADRRRRQEAAEHYEAAIAKTRAQIATLEERLRGETEGVAADTEDFQRLLEAQAKGTVSVSRLSDGRRTLLFSTTRELQTKSELDRAEMELETLSHERDRLRIEDHVGHLAELSAATLALETATEAVAAAERQLAYLEAASLDPASASDIAISITRPDGSARELTPDEDPELGPGDLIRVRLARPAAD